jgi:hypothetical protein
MAFILIDAINEHGILTKTFLLDTVKNCQAPPRNYLISDHGYNISIWKQAVTQGS